MKREEFDPGQVKKMMMKALVAVLLAGVLQAADSSVLNKQAAEDVTVSVKDPEVVKVKNFNIPLLKIFDEKPVVFDSEFFAYLKNDKQDLSLSTYMIYKPEKIIVPPPSVFGSKEEHSEFMKPWVDAMYKHLDRSNDTNPFPPAARFQGNNSSGDIAQEEFSDSDDS